MEVGGEVSVPSRKVGDMVGAIGIGGETMTGATVGFSVGITTIIPGDGADVGSLVASGIGVIGGGTGAGTGTGKGIGATVGGGSGAAVGARVGVSVVMNVGFQVGMSGC